MAYKILLKAGIKKYKAVLMGIFILILGASLALTTVLSIWTNSEDYMRSEIERVGFGDLTVWVSEVSNTTELVKEIKNISNVNAVEIQDLVYSNYNINNEESDSEGQLISYDFEKNQYNFLKDDLSGHDKSPQEILPGEIYVSPSLISMFNVKIGDIIDFPIARNHENMSFRIKGYYEDPFMGSSMIGMKGFLISEEDHLSILETIQKAGNDGLARDGGMLHIFSKEKEIPITVLREDLNEKTEISQYIEFVHSKDAIMGFMLILQNAFSGLLMAFVLILFCVSVLVLGQSISSTIEEEYINMGILKTIGFTREKLRIYHFLFYLIPVLSGMISGVILSIPLSGFVSKMTLTTTGVLIPIEMISPLLGGIILGVLVFLMGFIILKLRKILGITPMKAIRGETEGIKFLPKRHWTIRGEKLALSLVLRQLILGKKKYIGACLVAVLLVFFMSLVGRLDGWLGVDGKGMMDAFNPADHDIGVQALGEVTTRDLEDVILSYTNIIGEYLLAMPTLTVNGIDYAGNVISNPEGFHILEGKTALADNEVVITEVVARNLGISIGDSLNIKGDKGSNDYQVSGIYQCANEMGDNIGMSREGYLKIGIDSENLWCHHYFLADTSQKKEITKVLEMNYGGDVHVHENSWPGLLGIISAMKVLIAFMYVVATLFILIVTGMIGSKILRDEQKDLGIYKAMGFSLNWLRMSFALRFGIVAMIGSSIGVFLGILFTDFIVSFVMKFVGISHFSSITSLKNTLFPSMMVIGIFMICAYLLSGKIGKVSLVNLIRE